MVCKSNDAENNSDNKEAHDLDEFPAEGVDCCDGEPVAGDRARANEHKVADCVVKECVVDGGASGVANGA